MTTIAPVLFGVCVNPLLTQEQIPHRLPVPARPFPHYGQDFLNSLVAPGRSPVAPETVVNLDNVLELTGLSPEAFISRVNSEVPLPGGLQWFFGPFGALSHTGAPASQVPVTIDPNFETPYTRGYHLGLQQQLGRNQMVAVEYHHKDFENVLGVRITNLAFEARIPGNELLFEEPNTLTGINGFGPWYEGELDAVTLAYRRRMAGNFAPLGPLHLHRRGGQPAERPARLGT